MDDHINKLQPSSGYFWPALLGICFALILYPIWDFEKRWFVLVIAAIIMLSVAMMLIGRFSEYLTYFLVFCIPFAGFKKLYIPSAMADDGGIVLFSGTIGIGLLEFIIAGLYLSWFFRIFVTKEDPLPHLKSIDWVIILLIGAYFLSLWGVPNLAGGISTTLYLIEHVLIYLYFSRNLQARHLKWIIAGIMFTVAFEAAVGVLQTQAGLFQGWARDKGAGGVEIGSQYSVPGIEGFYRADGTVYDSHELGHMFVMLLPLPFVLLFTNILAWRYRLLAGAVFILGLAGLVATFSRSGWVSFAVTMPITMLIIVLYWKEKSALIGSIIIAALALIAAPWAINFIFERFASAPDELVTSRFEMYAMAWDIWITHPVFGYGAGNYMQALEVYGGGDAASLPVHNMPLWVLVDTGLVGFTLFHGMLAVVLWKLWQLIKLHDGLEPRIALALFSGIIGSFIDGLADPSLRGPSVYLSFWLYIAFSTALTSRQYYGLKSYTNL